jgi:cellulose synthase/poly-beta-1,6-N-acetylglucosamine synthase-like glycosyltransferase
VLVVADNCGDATAAVAESSGATVLERFDPEKRGKGYALLHAFEQSLRDGKADAVVVVDADTLVSANVLAAFAAHLQAGAVAVQAEYGVRNPDVAWRTRLMTIALGMFHIVRSRARERLRLSCGLRGNGMCFTHRVLREVPHQAFSLVEDLEYGLRLGEAGHRVHYAGGAHVYGEMVSGEAAARSQRRRWEDGRTQLARSAGPQLLRRALRRRDGVLLDLAFDLLLPPLSTVALWTIAFTAAAALLMALGGPRSPGLVFGACLVALVLYGMRGWAVSGTGWRGIVALLGAPAFVAWKLIARLRRSEEARTWVRTTREGRPP